MNNQIKTESTIRVSRTVHNLVVLSVLIFVLIELLPILNVPLMRDEGEYALCARVFLDGGLPYRDVFIQKPPGIWLVYAVTFFFFGTSTITIHVILLIATLASIVGVAEVARRISPLAGPWAGLMMGWLVLQTEYENFSTNTEILMILPTIIVIWMLSGLQSLIRSSHLVVVGILIFVASLMKQVAITNLIHVAILLAWMSPERFQGQLKKRWIRVSLFAMTVSLCWMILIACFQLRDGGHELLDGVWLHNFEYISGPMGGTTIGFLTDQLKHFSIVSCFIWGLAGASLLRFVFLKSWMPFAVFGGWLAASAWGLSVGGYFRGHYFIQILPPVAVLSGMGLALIHERVFRTLGRTRFPKTASAIPLLLLILIIGFRSYKPLHGMPADKISMKLYETPRFINAREMTEYLSKQISRNDRLYILGSEPQIYFRSGAKLTTRYVLANPLFGKYASSKKRQHQVWEKLSDNPPEYLILCFPSSIPLFPGSDVTLVNRVLDLVERSYRPMVWTSKNQTGTVIPAKTFNRKYFAENRFDLMLFERKDVNQKISKL